MLGGQLSYYLIILVFYYLIILQSILSILCILEDVLDGFGGVLKWFYAYVDPPKRCMEGPWRGLGES